MIFPTAFWGALQLLFMYQDTEAERGKIRASGTRHNHAGLSLRHGRENQPHVRRGGVNMVYTAPQIQST